MELKEIEKRIVELEKAFANHSHVKQEVDIITVPKEEEHQ